jgi:signal peptidase II
VHSEEQPGGAVAGRPEGGRVWLFGAVALSVVSLDLITKIIVVARLRPAESPRLFGGLLYLSLVRNPGAAFGLAEGMTAVFALAAAAVAVAIVRIAPRLRSAPWAVGLGLLLGGATGNLIDRLFRSPGPLRGRVVDFISVFAPGGARFPAFNVADSAITIGVLTLLVASLFGRRLDGSGAVADLGRRPG